MNKITKTIKPNVVLHHAHTTDTPFTWRNAWKSIEILLPEVRYLSTFRFKHYKPGHEVRGKLDDVLRSTKKGNVVDIIIYKK